MIDLTGWGQAVCRARLSHGNSLFPQSSAAFNPALGTISHFYPAFLPCSPFSISAHQSPSSRPPALYLQCVGLPEAFSSSSCSQVAFGRICEVQQPKGGGEQDVFPDPPHLAAPSHRHPLDHVQELLLSRLTKAEEGTSLQSMGR